MNEFFDDESPEDDGVTFEQYVQQAERQSERLRFMYLDEAIQKSNHLVFSSKYDNSKIYLLNKILPCIEFKV